MADFKSSAPSALSRADVVGRHLLKKAKEWGWEDDGEGAFEYIQRISYEQGLEDGKAHSSRQKSLILWAENEKS